MIARGSIERVEGGLAIARLPNAPIGANAVVGKDRVGAEILRIDGGLAALAVHGSLEGLAHGGPVVVDDAAGYLPLGTCLFGRAIGARGEPIDGKEPLRARRVGIAVPPPSHRVPIERPFWTGVRCIDALLTLGIGSRAGIFGAPGAGKSMLLEMLAASHGADALVVALVGERGREAQAWIDGLDSRTTIVCATSDRCAAERWRAARVALAQACALRERGLDVLVLLDSLARTAAALREIAVASGEPTGRGGYPASVFAQLARLVETAGAARIGSLTLVATVLDDGDERDPVSDAARSLLDAHVQLSSALVRANRFPAIDVSASASRTMVGVVAAEHLRDAAVVREAIALLARSEDARTLGIEQHGAAMEAAVRGEAAIVDFLRQDAHPCGPAQSIEALSALARALRIPRAVTLR
ncbi:MAG: EscN/YscN/HrcN family type III secretion system ATPase [Candidatus Tyrphobacter sp.]